MPRHRRLVRALRGLGVMVVVVLAAAWLATAAAAQAAGAEVAMRTLFGAGIERETAEAILVTRGRELRLPGTSHERTELSEGTRLELRGTIAVRAEAKRYAIELWEGTRPQGGEGGFGDDVALLAVFPEGARLPTDVAEVKSDRETYLDSRVVPLGADDGFAILNAHLNAGEDFNRSTLFHVREGRLRRIDDVFLKGERVANCARSFRQSLHWGADPQGGRAPRIVVEIETVRAPRDFTSEDCPRRKVAERREHERFAYRWDAGSDRYVREAGRAPPQR